MQDTLYRKNRGRTDTKGETETLSRHTKKCATRKLVMTAASNEIQGEMIYSPT